MSRFRQVFTGTRAPIIGMISLPPLPGHAGSPGMPALIEAALADLDALERGGADAALVENDFDLPHTMHGTPATIAAMAAITREVVRRASVPVGVQILLNDWRASLAVAAAAGAQFVRLDFFVDRVAIKAGLVEPQPAAVITYRHDIGAAHVLLLTDLQVKYSTPAGAPKSIEQSAIEAAAAGSDAVIITGAETAIGPDPADLRDARAGGLPVLIGSGLTPANLPRMMPLADGAIVGTCLRSGRAAHDRVVLDQVRMLIAARDQMPAGAPAD